MKSGVHREGEALPAKILCVDDDINILVGFQRNLRKRFDITNALGGPAALKILDEQGPFAVILSDMRMPGMTGFEFLARANEKSPNSIQVVLTGAADMNMAVEAANSGRIHRFLVKPCPLDRLMETLTAAVDLYNTKEEARKAAAQLPKPAPTAPKASSHAPSSGAADLVTDPVTGLPAMAEAETAIRAAIGSAGETHIAIFFIERMQFTKERFGLRAVQQVVHFAAQHLASRMFSLWREPGLFRWRGPSFVMIGAATADALTAESKGLAALPIEYHFETNSRSAFIPVKFAATVLDATGLEADEVFARLDDFLAAHAEP